MLFHCYTVLSVTSHGVASPDDSGSCQSRRPVLHGVICRVVRCYRVLSVASPGVTGCYLSRRPVLPGLNQVECVASDNASTKLYTQLRRIMPNLQCLCLDPIHLPIVYEQPVRKLFSFSNPDTILKSPFERADSGTPLGARRQQVLCACESSCTSSSPSTKTPRQTTGASSTRVTTIAP